MGVRKRKRKSDLSPWMKHCDVTSLSRPNKTARITECVQFYWMDKRYSCHEEIGLVPRGRLRADVLCLNTKANIIITEVKSCISDFRTDRKWFKYLSYCNKFYFAIDSELHEKHFDEIKKSAKEKGAGIILVSDEGTCSVVLKAQAREVTNKTLAALLVKLAWRGGRFKR